MNYRSKDTTFYHVPGILPLLIFLAYIGIQLVPLPSQVIEIISPATYNLYRETVLIDNPAAWVSLSINRKATMLEFFRIASYGAFYVVTVQLLSQKDRLRKTIAAVIIFASCLSFFGILQHILWNNKIFWFRELTKGGVPFGPYVNRNHYAGLMEMIFPLVIGLFLVYKPHVAYVSFREKVAEIFRLQRTNIHILLGFAAVLIGTSIFLTLSRSGILSLCLSMIIFGLMVVERGANRKRGILIIIVFILIGLSVGWFGWNPIIERFKEIAHIQGDISDFRPFIWKDSKNIVKDFLLTGTGFGSFVTIYPQYRTLSVSGIVEHAHNDYIELLSNGGIIAFLLIMWFMFVVFYKSYRAFLQRHELYSMYLFIGSIAGIVSILIHSITDFNLQVGANGLYFFFLAGLAVSTANTRLREGLNDTYLKKTGRASGRLVISAGVLFLICSLFNGGVLLGNISFAEARDAKLSKNISEQELLIIRSRAYRASLFDPLEAHYHYAGANTEKLLSKHDAALHHFRRAVQLNPVNGEYLQRLGLLMSEMQKYDTADRLLRSGIAHDARNPERYRRYAVWLLSAGKKQDAADVIKTAISLEPQKTKEYITLLVIHQFSDEEIFGYLPERVEPRLLFADYLLKTGKEHMAEDTYLNALQYTKNEETIKPSYFYTVYGYYMRKGRAEDALSVMRSAVGFLPEDAGIRLTTGALYEKLGITYRAIDEYRKVLMIDPARQDAKKRLENLLSKTKGR
jgi:O-antigen ligase/Tfp pilus assembly protein PilF